MGSEWRVEANQGGSFWLRDPAGRVVLYDLPAAIAPGVCRYLNVEAAVPPVAIDETLRGLLWAALAVPTDHGRLAALADFLAEQLGPPDVVEATQRRTREWAAAKADQYADELVETEEEGYDGLSVLDSALVNAARDIAFAIREGRPANQLTPYLTLQRSMETDEVVGVLVAGAVADIVREAVAAEREWCAKVAEEGYVSLAGVYESCDVPDAIRAGIAAAIREGASP